jgi:hypothetical protein
MKNLILISVVATMFISSTMALANCPAFKSKCSSLCQAEAGVSGSSECKEFSGSCVCPAGKQDKAKGDAFCSEMKVACSKYVRAR